MWFFICAGLLLAGFILGSSFERSSWTHSANAHRPLQTGGYCYRVIREGTVPKDKPPNNPGR